MRFKNPMPAISGLLAAAVDVLYRDDLPAVSVTSSRFGDRVNPL